MEHLPGACSGYQNPSPRGEICREEQLAQQARIRLSLADSRHMRFVVFGPYPCGPGFA
jgi:hypothetical protein